MLPIHSGEGIVAQLAGTKAFPCTKFGTTEPIVNEKGVQLWQFYIQVPGRFRFEQFAVETFAKSDPIEGAVIGDSVELAGVTAEIGFKRSQDGEKPQKNWHLIAESVSLLKQGA